MKILEANGAQIPALGLGTWDLRGDLCTQIVSEALKTGYTHIDTAIMYQNEREVGEGLRNSGKAREDYFVTTKVWPTDFSEGTYQAAVEGSLERLGLDHVDLLLIHWPPKSGTVEEWARLINDVADRGWARHLGVSNFTVAQMEAISGCSERPIVCNQVENHPFLDQTRIRETCSRLGMALIGYCPLYRGDGLFDHSVVREIIADTGATPAQVVLAWHFHHAGSGAIPKTATVSRLAENLAALDVSLNAQQMAALNGLMVKQHRLCQYDFSPEWDPV